MDGASRMFAAPTTLKLGGVEYEIKARTVELYAAIEQHIQEERGPTPLELVSKELKNFQDYPEHVRYLLDAALEQTKARRWVSRLEIMEFLSSYQGLIYSMWLQIRGNDPAKLTLEYVGRQFWEDFEREEREDAQKVREEGSTTVDRIAVLEKNQAALQEKLDELGRLLARPSGEDTLGNSTGPAPA